MNKIEIKNRWNGDTIFEYETENNTIKKTLEKAVREGAYLRGAYLRGADLRYANLSNADLSNADLRGANLSDTNLSDANLSDTNLSGTYLRGAYLSDANLSNTNLSGTNLRGAYIYLSDEEIDQVKVIDNFEKNANIKITESYINHDVIPTRWNCFWENGLIIREWEVKPKARKMTIEEISEALGYPVKVVERRN